MIWMKRSTHSVRWKIEFLQRSFVLKYVGRHIVQWMMCVVQDENVITIALCCLASAIEARPPRHIIWIFVTKKKKQKYVTRCFRLSLSSCLGLLFRFCCSSSAFTVFRSSIDYYYGDKSAYVCVKFRLWIMVRVESVLRAPSNNWKSSIMNARSNNSSNRSWFAFDPFRFVSLTRTLYSTNQSAYRVVLELSSDKNSNCN